MRPSLSSNWRPVIAGALHERQREGGGRCARGWPPKKPLHRRGRIVWNHPPRAGLQGSQ